MNAQHPTKPRLGWLPLMVLGLGLLGTIGATWTLAEISHGLARVRFASATTQLRTTIEARMKAQITLLQGAAGLFAATDSVDRDAFRRYVARLDLATNYPGVQGVGFSARISADERAAFEARAQEMGLEQFRIWPATPRDEYHSIVFLEPLDRRNRAALGYDMFTEATRREAMARAVVSGVAALSGPVTLVQEIDEQKQAGFLIYLPVYAGGQTPPSVAERHTQLLGFVYSPFRADDLFQGIFGDAASQWVAVAIYDGAMPEPAALLHHSALPIDPTFIPSFTKRETVSVGGRPWMIVYSSLPAFDATGDRYLIPLTLTLGAALSLALFLLVRAQAAARLAAEEAVRTRDAFFSVASHELKTPLTALLGNAQLLERRAARSGTMSEGEQRALGQILDGGRRLNRLVDELLDHSRLQEGRLSLNLQPLELSELVQRVAEEVVPALPRHRLEIRSANERLPIFGDPPRLERVLLNLIGNAAKYSPAGGLIELELDRAETWAVIQVRDQGIGIPPEALPRLFEQYYRAPNAVAQRIPGMGIGLHVVYELIERHQGAIIVTSAEGRGSVFEVRLPLTTEAAAINEPAHHANPRAPTARP